MSAVLKNTIFGGRYEFFAETVGAQNAGRVPIDEDTFKAAVFKFEAPRSRRDMGNITLLSAMLVVAEAWANLNSSLSSDEISEREALLSTKSLAPAQKVRLALLNSYASNDGQTRPEKKAAVESWHFNL